MELLLILILVGTLTCFFGVTFGLFLLYLTLKIKSEFRETFRYEIDRHRKVYDFIRQRGTVSVEELVERFDGLTPEDVKFPTQFLKWQKFLKKRIDDFKTLKGYKNTVTLTPKVKRFFVFDNPSLGDLLNYIYFVYIKREKLPIKS